MTDKIILTERQQAIDICLKACVNLYGFVTPRQFLKVFNRYNKPKMLKKELLDNADILESVSGNYYEIYENAIVNKRVNEDTINRTIHMQNGKNYYTPSQEEVLLYSKANYYPQTVYTAKLMQVLTGKFKMNIFSANNFVTELMWFTVTDEHMQKRINLLARHNIALRNQTELNSLVAIFQDINNSTRKWANCGYTPEELKKIAE